VTGVVVGEPAATGAPDAALRPLEALLDAEPAVSRELVDLAVFVAGYYEAPLGAVLRAALPAGTRVSAGAAVRLTDAGRAALAGEGAMLGRRAREALAKIAAAGARGARETALGRARAELPALELAGLVARGREEARARVRE